MRSVFGVRKLESASYIPKKARDLSAILHFRKIPVSYRWTNNTKKPTEVLRSAKPCYASAQ